MPERRFPDPRLALENERSRCSSLCIADEGVDGGEFLFSADDLGNYLHWKDRDRSVRERDLDRRDRSRGASNRAAKL
jgi:hypothetical protein